MLCGLHIIKWNFGLSVFWLFLCTYFSFRLSCYFSSIRKDILFVKNPLVSCYVFDTMYCSI